MSSLAADRWILIVAFPTPEHEVSLKEGKERHLQRCSPQNCGEESPLIRQRERLPTSARPRASEKRGTARAHCVTSPHMIHVVFLSALGVMHHVPCFIFLTRRPSHFVKSSTLKGSGGDGCRPRPRRPPPRT